MENFDSNVQEIMDYLKSRNYGTTVICAHKRCYRELRNYLIFNKLAFTEENCNQWLNSVKDNLCKTTYKDLRKSLLHLVDLSKTGKINSYIYGNQIPPYNTLCDTLKNELDSCLENLPQNYDDKYKKTIRFVCTRFMVFLQNKNIRSLKYLNHKIVYEYILYNKFGNTQSQECNINYARKLLKFFGKKNYIPEELYLLMDKKIITHVIFPANLAGFITSENEKLGLGEIRSFFKQINSTSYSNTVRKCLRHDIKAMYLFFYINNLSFIPDNVDLWLNLMKRILNTGFKTWRRSVRLFQYYKKNGSVNPEVIFTYYRNRTYDLPIWYRSCLERYLSIRKREGLQKSSICMYRNSLIRFGMFLTKEKIACFTEITANHLTKFNLEDKHSTTEGKNAYNIRIRNFLEYLELEKIILVPNLHKALMTNTAPKVDIVEVLPEETQKTIVDFQHSNVRECREKAITYLGFFMGFRSIDIVNLKYSDIDWQNRTIRIIQQKTLTEIIQPMPVIVGNAIHEYISNARPYCNSPYIFIQHRSPYSKLDRSSCSRALRKVAKDDSIKGFHITRKTFATNLFNSGTQMNLVVNALGHRSDSTVGEYLNLNNATMLLCSMSLSESNINLGKGFDLWK